MESIIDKSVVQAYFSGRTTPLQKKAIEHWLALPDSREQYYQWLHEWELTHPQTAPDWQRAFERTARRVLAPSVIRPSEIPEDAPPVFWGGFRPWLFAASLTLLLGGWLFRSQLLYQTERSEFGQVRTLTLPDGSTVTLNVNSSIRFARFGFASDWPGSLPGFEPSRRVELTGEADFSVQHLPTHQRFVVVTPNGLHVTVLGTEFTVTSRTRKTAVALRSGKVELTLAEKTQLPPLTMQPGDFVTLDSTGHLARRQLKQPDAVVAWKHHRFTFEQTPLGEIAGLLEDNYGLSVSISSPELAARTVSGSFPASNADDVLKLLVDLLQINYTRTDNRVLLTD
ncbi:MAG: FecR domain-containing protein [Spirosoma sp.]|nr:FecR domain-containing protein [Spirosoma sp.]